MQSINPSLHDMLTEHLRRCSDCADAAIHARPVANLGGRSPMCTVYQLIIEQWAQTEAKVNHISPPIPWSPDQGKGITEEELREYENWKTQQESLNKDGAHGTGLRDC